MLLDLVLPFSWDYFHQLMLPTPLAIVFDTVKSRSVKSAWVAVVMAGGRQLPGENPLKLEGSQADWIQFLRLL